MNKKLVSVSELAALVGGELEGDDVKVSDLADITTAESGQVAFIDDKCKLTTALASGASALIIPSDIDQISTLPAIKVKDPVWAAAVIHDFLLSKDFVPTGIDDRTVVGEDCSIPEDISVAASVVIGDRVRFGHRVDIKAGAVIGDDVVIGSDVLVYPNVSIQDRCVIGNRVIIHSGSVIGSDGFGYANDQKGRYVKRPQVGFVQIEDDVEIGANVCIDRATFGKTWIKRGTKIDNLVQIGHNVVIGEDSIIVAQCGISGSTSLGDGVIMGGKAAVSGHLKIGNRVTMAGKAGVMSDQEDDAVVAGFPAFSHRKWLRASSLFQKLPDLFREVRELRKKIRQYVEKSDGD